MSEEVMNNELRLLNSVLSDKGIELEHIGKTDKVRVKSNNKLSPEETLDSMIALAQRMHDYRK
jgi:hypothetical protein